MCLTLPIAKTPTLANEVLAYACASRQGGPHCWSGYRMEVALMLKNAIEAERAERDQEADCARIDAAIVVSEQDITALEDQQLDQLEMQKRWSAIRDRTNSRYS